MILGPMRGGKFEKLLGDLQRVVDLLRLAKEKHVSIGLRYQAGTLDLSREAIHRVPLRLVTNSVKLETPKVPTPCVTNHRSAVLFCINL